MAKPKKYTKRRTVRFDDEGDQALVKKAGTMGLEPAVAIRVIVEHAVIEDSSKKEPKK